MPRLPLPVWFTIGVAALVLVAIAAAGPLGVLRDPATRARAAARPGRVVLLLVLLAVVPWVAVFQVPVQVEVSIHSSWLLALWVLATLGAFTVLVPLPLAALSAALVWSLARRSHARRSHARRSHARSDETIQEDA